jgi:hypothetical protein
MATAVMRNRVSTEFRKVERDSEEYLDLQAQRDPNDGRPVWEETGFHDAKEQSERLESGNAQPWDVGDAEQPVATIAGVAAGYTSSAEVNEPLPSEREAGAEQDEGPMFGLGGEIESEVPLIDAMDEPTDTDLSGTDDDIAEQVREAKQPKSQSDKQDESGGESSRSARSRSRKKPSEGGAPSPTGGETQS